MDARTDRPDGADKEDEIPAGGSMGASLPRLPRNIPAATAFCPSASNARRGATAEAGLCLLRRPAMAEARGLLLCAGVSGRELAHGDEGPIAPPSARYILRATRSRTGIFLGAHGLRDQAGDGGDIYVSEGSCDFSRHAGDPAVPAAGIFLSAGRTSCMWSSSPIDQIRVPTKVKGRPRYRLSPRCGSTASSPRLFHQPRQRPQDYIAAGKCRLNYAPLHEGRQASGGGRRDHHPRSRQDPAGDDRQHEKGRIAIEITRFLWALL